MTEARFTDDLKLRSRQPVIVEGIWRKEFRWKPLYNKAKVLVGVLVTPLEGEGTRCLRVGLTPASNIWDVEVYGTPLTPGCVARIVKWSIAEGYDPRSTGPDFCPSDPITLLNYTTRPWRTPKKAPS